MKHVSKAHHYNIYVCFQDGEAEAGAEPTASEPVSCAAASVQPYSFGQHSSPQRSSPAPGDWTEDGQTEGQKWVTSWEGWGTEEC